MPKNAETLALIIFRRKLDNVVTIAIVHLKLVSYVLLCLQLESPQLKINDTARKQLRLLFELVFKDLRTNDRRMF